MYHSDRLYGSSWLHGTWSFRAFGAKSRRRPGAPPCGLQILGLPNGCIVWFHASLRCNFLGRLKGKNNTAHFRSAPKSAGWFYFWIFSAHDHSIFCTLGFIQTRMTATCSSPHWWFWLLPAIYGGFHMEGSPNHPSH